MKIKKYISSLLIITVLLGILPAQAIEVGIQEIIDNATINQVLSQMITQEVSEVERQQFTDLIYRAENLKYSDLTQEEKQMILSYCDVQTADMELWEAEGLTVPRTLSCIAVMRQTGLTIDEMKIAERAYQQIEDLIPTFKIFKQFSAENSIDETEYERLRQSVLDGTFTDNQQVAAQASTFSGEEEVWLNPLVGLAPFALQNGSNETVSPNTGNLTLKYPLVYLPGRNGLDVALSISYSSSDAAMFRTNFALYPSDVPGKVMLRMGISTSYNEQTADIGAGWRWNLPSIDEDAYVLYLGDGSSYKLTQSCDSLLDHPLQDMRLYSSSDYTSTGNVKATRKLKMADGTTWWFGQYGRVIGQTDRFGNRISYEYTNEIYGWSRLNKIVDTSNRAITISYSENTITITPPDGNATVLTQEYYYAGNRDRRLLKSIKDAEQQTTSFEYSVENMPFTFYPYGVVDNLSVNLRKVKHPTGGETRYTYIGVLEGDNPGYYLAYKLETRKDIIGTTEYAKRTYNYIGTYTGFRSGSSSVFPSYTYSTSCTNGDGMYTLYTFNNEGLVTDEESSFAGATLTKRQTEYKNRLPTKVSERIYTGQNYMDTILAADYDEYGQVIASWNAYAYGIRNDEFKTTITYDSAYRLPLTKTYKVDSNITVLERYTLTADKKNIEYLEILENDVLRQRIKYGYESNGYGNVTSQQVYRDDNTSYTETIYQYDTNGNLTYTYTKGIKNAAGQAVTTPGLPSGCVGMRYTHDNMGRILTATDDRGFVTTYGYDKIGQIKTITHPDNTAISYNRNYAGNILRVTDEMGRTTRYEFNPFGYELRVWDETAGAQVAQKTYDNMFRLKTEQGAANTAIVTYGYDALSRIRSVEAKSGSAILAKETYEYDSENFVGHKVTKTVYGGTMPNQVSVQYTNVMGYLTRAYQVKDGVEYLFIYNYDYIGRLTTERDVRAGDVNNTRKWEYTYDGQVSREYNAEGQYISFVYQNLPTGKVVRGTDYSGNEAIARYDDLGRLIAEETPVVNLNGTIHYAKTEYYYDRGGVAGKLEMTRQRINEPGKAEQWKTMQNYYNSRGFLTSTEMQNGTSALEKYSYTYDSIGRMRTMTDPLGRVTRTDYNDTQRKETRTDPMNQVETVTYNASGLPATKIDRNGVTHSWTYDGLGRERIYSAGGLQRSTEYSWAGQITFQSDGTTTVSYEYDALGLLRKQTETGPDGPTVQTFDYNKMGQRQNYVLTVGGASKLTSYTYDKLKRLKTVTQGGQTAVYEYDTNGNRKTLTIGNVVTTYGYNLANWVTSLENKVGGQIQSGYTYSYKLDGNQAYKSQAITGQTVTYAYDAVGRLKSETYAGTVAGNGAVVYNYDKAGNRETMTDTRTGAPIVTAYHYDPNNRLEQTDKSASDGTVVTQRYGYDRNGNQTSMLQEVLHPAENPPATAALSFGGVYELSEYDAFGRMVTVKTDTVEAEYTYNPNGLRHSKTVNGETRVHVWDGGQMAAEVLEDGSVARYIRGVNLLWSDKASGKETYLHNAHGDVVAVSGTTGLREYSYDAFGNQLQQGVPIAWDLVITTADTNPFRYCGEYFDSETGNVYLRARYYNTATGRFRSEDPIRDGHNWYVYCYGNPVVYVDPSGLAGMTHMMIADGGAGGWGAPEANIPHPSLVVDIVSFLFSAILHGVNTNIDFDRGISGDIRGAGESALHYTNNSALSFSGYILDQFNGNAAKAEMGYAVLGSNACGWIAAYNAFVSIGQNVHPAEIIKYLEYNNGLISDGAFGVNPSVYVQLFSNFGESAQTTFIFTDELDIRAQSGRTAILCYVNQGGIQNGAHFINITWDAATGQYNAYNNGAIQNFASIDDFIANHTGGFISLTIIE